jgi:small-conductance mechanosensitive channel
MYKVAFLNENFTTTLATAGTTLLSLSFVFSTTAQEVLGSCVFLFVSEAQMHQPVGDAKS